ncbi:MAG TPA: amino acid permease, partial [Blastocatellia bacterium]
ESSRFNAVMVGIKIIVLTFFIIVGFTYVQPANWTPFAPNGFIGISTGAAIVFFAYIGFDAVSTVAEETRDPQRNLPIGIIASLIICTIVYAVVAAVFTGLISFGDLQTKTPSELSAPLTMALEHAGQSSGVTFGWTAFIVDFGSVIAHTAVLLVFQLGQPRIFFSMARDGLLPKVFYKVHPKYRTPHVSTILTGVFVAVFAAFASIDEMIDLTNIGTLFAFILVCAGIIVLRVKEPNRERPFKVPGGILVAGLGIVACLYLIYFLPPTSWLRFAAWLNLGFVIYVGYGSMNSRLTGKTQTDDVAALEARTAYTGAWLSVIGTLLLVLMRWLDLFLEANKAENNWGAAFQSAMKMDAWIELSWFMVVPMALNALVLCPIVIKRALRGKGKESTGASITIAAVVGLLTLIYLVMVFAHQSAS